MTASERDAPWRGGRVLLVDDDDDFRASLAAVLESDFAVQEAPDAEEAHRHLGEREFDVLVTDHTMPGEKGTDLIAFALARHPGMGLILMTGDARSKAVRAANEAGKVLVLFKPFRPDELITWIRSAVVMRRLRPHPKVI
jgi:DNA-binding NtrC family response regulator